MQLVLSLSCILDIKSRRLTCLSFLSRKKMSSIDNTQSLCIKTKCKYMRTILKIITDTVSYSWFLKKIILETISLILWI